MSHTLVLVRHGESLWNLENLFTGWTDIGLTDKGRAEAAEAGRLIVEAGLRPDVLYTSVLSRAVDTADLAVAAAGWDLPTERSWRLNERHYGALQGLNKKETADKYGADQVMAWRRSYDVPPPPLDPTDERHPSYDARYSDVASELLPASECLADVVERMQPYWEETIVPALLAGLTPLIVAHGNSLRALVMRLDGLSPEEIVGVNIPTGIPLVYTLDNDLRSTGRRYLGDEAAAQAAADAVGRQAG